MKSENYFFNEFENYIIPSDIIEFIYCKRFIYYMKCLQISQNEEKRFKVQKGREIHNIKEKENRDYLRKKLGVIKKEISVTLISKEYKIKGIVDEVLTLKNGEKVLLDYKYAEYEEKIYETYFTQLCMYAIMIDEMYNCDVKKAYLVFCRTRNKLVEVNISQEDKLNIKNIIGEYTKVIGGYFPKKTKYSKRCIDCCYKNICV